MRQTRLYIVKQPPAFSKTKSESRKIIQADAFIEQQHTTITQQTVHMLQADGNVSGRVQHVRGQHHVVVLLQNALRRWCSSGVKSPELGKWILWSQFVFCLAHQARRKIGENEVNAACVARKRRQHTA